MPGVNAGACEYQSATAPATVQVYVWCFSNDSTGQFLRQRYEKGCASKERLSGLGDVACWYNSEHRELQVLKGTSFLIIRPKDDGNATEVLTTVSKKALARLP